MSIAASQSVWHRSGAKGSARLVLLALADHAGDDGRAWPSAARLARLTMLDVRNVQRALTRLVEAGEIAPVGTGKRGVIVYQIRPGGISQPTAEAPYVGPVDPAQPTAEAPYVEPPNLRRRRRTAEASYGGGVAVPTAEAPYVPTALAPCKPSLTVIEPSIEAAAALQAAFDLWNSLAESCGLKSVQRLTETRAVKLAARIDDAGGPAGWAIALNKISQTPGLLGQSPSGWRITLDWLIDETHFARLLEGIYDDWNPATPRPADDNGRLHNDRRRSPKPKGDLGPVFEGIAMAVAAIEGRGDD